MASYQVMKQGRIIRFETEMDLETAYDLVNSNPREGEFGRSLCRAYRDSRGQMSYGRRCWLLYIAIESQRQSRKPAVAQAMGVDLGRIKALLAKANEHIKWPKIRLRTASGRKVVLSVAGPKSKYAGAINVTDGSEYGTPGSYFGRIEDKSIGAVTTVNDPEVLALLRDFALDPASMAAHYGRGTGNCCFCGRELTNSEAGSVEVGYGPVCAAHYGLPWKSNGKSFEYREGGAVHVEHEQWVDQIA